MCPLTVNGFPYPSAGLPLQWMADRLEAAVHRNVNGSGTEIHT